MITAVDTNILLDLLAVGSPWFESSHAALDRVTEQDNAIVSETVYAELAARFDDAPALDQFLAEHALALVASSNEALSLAGHAWRRYTRTRLPTLECSRCGSQTQARCSNCEAPLSVRQRMLGDFLVGAHASSHADRLLTRDLGYYRRYFPDLELV